MLRFGNVGLILLVLRHESVLATAVEHSIPIHVTVLRVTALLHGTRLGMVIVRRMVLVLHSSIHVSIAGGRSSVTVR